MANKVIYTAIFGDKDEIRTVATSKHCDYVVFTDNPKLRSGGFTVVTCPAPNPDPTRNAKFYKILSHQVLADYEYSLWIDANISISGAPVEDRFDEYLSAHDIALHPHPSRNCIYDEAKACIDLNKDDPAKINHQMEVYRARGYPKNNELASLGIIYRRHTEAIARLNNTWWLEITTHSRRDQLSFNYSAWKCGITYHRINGHVRLNNVPGFELHPHTKTEDFRYWQ